MEKPMSVTRMRRMKSEGTPIAVVTAYDYPSAGLAEEAGADVILVGDSLGNVVLGYDSTVPVTLDDMIHHTKAVTRAVSKSFVVTDMPFLTYHGSTDQTLRNAGRIMQEGLAKAVKMEGGEDILASAEACVKAGIPVMGHLGFTPQSVHQLGGYFIQGKTADQALKMLEDAKRLEQTGIFAIVLELVPEELARLISEQISIPTIGIGAGAGCDGQVLVFHDLLQYGPSFPKKFVKAYANIGDQIRNGLAQYVNEVKKRQFPGPAHSFPMEQEAVHELYGYKLKG
ncbi:3-methyl-2-oxobutanoate hydroxymethyltransferase [Ferviditalea candida]|uniref:3-methyl-2-oxobutanoate hydroxymethyltransferase n=1 Tax=Ferviditalea candida TaxID=3108399 RepID=A0ABU5ZGG8_9BACL|nr:3-methyl-2-oxobutanoate hydroxymethyltransferase [Paenibacillaceae bacterium T2]